jgi:hypothetical protein
MPRALTEAKGLNLPISMVLRQSQRELRRVVSEGETAVERHVVSTSGASLALEMEENYNIT